MDNLTNLKLWIAWLFLLIGTSCFSQNVTMTNATINNCSGILLDPGGVANYPNNSNITTTICPGTAGGSVLLSFTLFNTELNWDDLTIYDGNSTAAPILGTYGGSLPAFSVQATNATGCLTLVFQSDATLNFAGFSANISCVYPCQAFTAVVNSTTPAAVGGFIDICLGQSLIVNGGGNYSNSPGNYTQTNASSTFEWFFGDLSAGNNAISSHTYATPGVFDLDLNITDVNGCTNANDIDIKVRVSGAPTYIGTNTVATDICLGQTNDLSGFVQATPLTYFCESSNADTTVIPDGVGVSYTSDLDLDCFGPAATISSASDISSICLDLEHSYIHDLTITLSCPNGASIDLYATYPGAVNSVQFGQPVDDDLSSTLGLPYTYCFTNTAANTIYSIAEPAVGTPPVQNYTDQDGTPVAGAFYIPAGNYLPDQGFGNLIGCPLNGDWTITITDGLNSDNGTIFNWAVDFDPSLYSTNNNFTPSIAANWLPDPTITSNVGNTILVTPVTTGASCYVFESTDQFGCAFDTTVCFNVTPIDDATFAYGKALYCKSDSNPTPNITGTPGGVFSATGGLPINSTTGQIDLTIATNGNYTVTYTTFGTACPASSSVILDIISSATANFSVNVTTGCSPLTVNFTNLSINSVNCTWSFGDGNQAVGCVGISHIYQNGGSFSPSLTIIDANGCIATSTQVGLIQPDIKPTAAFIPSPATLSVVDQTSVMSNTSVGATSYTWFFPNGQTSSATSPIFTFNLSSNESAVVTLYAYSDGGCADSTSRTITLTEELIFYAPNAFTPNNDENNAVFNPMMTSGIDISSYKLTIFNRWGEIVFVSQDINQGWDGTNNTGKKSQDGVYKYVIEFSRKNVDEPERFDGHVNLLR